MAAAPGASVGATGTLRVTLTDPVHGRATAAARVRVGADVDLVAGVEAPAEAAVGDSFVRTVSVRNAGPTPVAGVVAVFGGGSGVTDDDTDYRNCRYGPDGRLLRCLFDTALAPGAAYRARLPMRVTDSAFAPGTQHSTVTWLTRREAAETPDSAPEPGGRGTYPGPTIGAGHADGDGEPGAEAPLVLRRTSRFPAPPPPHAAPPRTARKRIRVSGDNRADILVQGSTTVAAAGATVDLTVSVTNDGPADLARHDDERAVVAVDVILPSGVAGLAAPTGCEERDEVAWRCYAQASSLPARAGQRWAFRARVNRVVPDGAGEVALAHDEWVALGEDLRRDNNTAPLVVKG
ncbi:MAG TPA: hypothetical protein VFY17_00100 [Pilimelia sp.]|nr:hypothetical protein [Pilimelia sp.]